jgi:hypothetical protein
MLAGRTVTGAAGVLRYGWRDAPLVLLALGHGLLLLAVPSLPVVAVGVWWNSNTIAHNFLHTPFFRRRGLNALFGLYLTVLLGVPQSVWRDRHLAHHAGVPPRVRLTGRLAVELALVLGLWGTLLVLAPRFFLTAYAPGYVLGLGLCAVHGHYEHAGGGTLSHYGRLYNWLFFNDGYHVEHHASPGTHWSALPARGRAPRASRWPAPLRWLELFSVEALERLALRSPALQRFVLARHERALRALLPLLPPVRRAVVVGGGLFPRTALVLRRLLPGAELVVLDGRAEHIEVARPFLGGDVGYVHAWYDPARHGGFDLVVIPLSYVGDRAALYRRPPAPAVLVHDWLWRRRGASRVVSWLLLKRLNLVRP